MTAIGSNPTIRAFYLPRIRYPGSFVDCEADGFAVKNHLHRVETEIVNAWLALATFHLPDPDYIPLEERISISSQRARAAECEAIQRLENAGQPPTPDLLADVIRAVRLEWRLGEGKLPDGWAHQRKYAAAQNFTAALNRASRLLCALKRYPVTAGPAGEAEQRIGLHLPDLKHVRDSDEHTEARVVQEAWGRPIPTPALGPRFEGLISGEVWVSAALVGAVYTTPTADGRMGEIEISCDSLQVIVDAFQHVIDGIPFRGMSRLWPTGDHVD